MNKRRATKAFERTGAVRQVEHSKDQKIAQLENKMAQKSEVVAETADRGSSRSTSN